MKKILLLTAVCFIYMLFSFNKDTFGSEKRPQPLLSTEAYRLVTKSPADTFIVDVRTRVEYEFVGHPDLPNGVPNIPIKFYPDWRLNKNFLEDVLKRYKRSDTIITICRSGQRALLAADLLVNGGFENVYYMTDSFEGEKDERGLRTINGWKNNGLPYTYELDKDLIYN